jgi:hypothetical protein
MRSTPQPPPVGTRDKTLHEVMSRVSSKATISSSIARLSRVTVVLICSGKPISRAHIPLNRQKDTIVTPQSEEELSESVKHWLKRTIARNSQERLP